jgi:putative nucleotidyltransferase with HDIG domain
VLFVRLPAETRESIPAAFAAYPGWHAHFVQTAEEALQHLNQGGAEAIVASLHRADSDAIALLNDVMICSPKAVRLLLAPPDLWATAMKYLGVVHQFLLEPCDGTALTAALDQAFQYKTWLPQEAVCQVVAQMRRIPSPPAQYFQVVRELQELTASLDRVGECIARDPAMTARLLQFVNSAFFGLRRTIADPAEAVMYLGAETTKSLILLAHSFSYFDSLLPAGFTVDEIWRHSLSTANLARMLAQEEGVLPEQAAQTYTAGLLHDLGKLALAANLPKEFHHAASLASQQGIPLWQAEQQVFQADHAGLGACLLAIWGLAPNLVEAVALHHCPRQLSGSGFTPLVAVHVANVFDHEARGHTAETFLDQAYLAAQGLDQRVEVWRELCQEALRCPP